MKIVAIPDVHGTTLWKYIVEKETDADKIVFIGDYWDSLNIPFEEQSNNFLEICKFKSENSDKVVLLIGNHDYHYMEHSIDNFQICSGFQNEKAIVISYIIRDNIDKLQMSYRWKNWLFTHAGVTSIWMNNFKFNKQNKYPEKYINELANKLQYAFYMQSYDPYGDSVKESPIWVRPYSLMRNAFRYETLKQVVGHTCYKNIEVVKDRYFFIDNCSNEYLVIENNNYEIKSVA